MKVREEFKTINNRVKFIDKIADRTNLLALKHVNNISTSLNDMISTIHNMSNITS